MGRIIQHATDSTSINRTRNSLGGTQRQVNTIVPGDTQSMAIIRQQSDNIARNLPLAMTIEPRNVNLSYTLPSGHMRLAAVVVPTSVVVTGVGIAVDVLPTGTLTAFNGWALYSFDNGDRAAIGPNLNLVAYRAGTTLTDAWGSTPATYLQSMAAQSFTIGRGLYYIGVCVNTTNVGPMIQVNANVPQYLHTLGQPMPFVCEIPLTSLTPPNTIPQSSVVTVINIPFLTLIGLTG